MSLKHFATLPFAFASGIWCTVGYRAFGRWAAAHRVGSTGTGTFVALAAFVALPFLICVVGVDTKRWEGSYWFSDEGKADSRRMWTRWGIYFVAAVIGDSIG